ncbi:MAG: VanW family protein, partial [Clostridiaceae bacterium]
MKKTQITIAVVTSLLILGGCSNLDIPTTSGGDSTASQTTQTTATTAPEKKLTTEEVKILQNYGNKIFNGVKVNGIDVGGMTKDEAMEKLTTELVDPLADRYVLFKYNGLDDYMSYNRLEVKLDPETVNEAMKAGKSTDNFKMLEYAKTSYPASIKAKLSYDKDHLNRVVEDVRKFVLNTSMAKAAEMVDGHVVLKKDAKADKLDVKKLTDALVAAIDFNPEDNERIDAVIEKVPAPVTQADLDVINSKISSFTTDYSWSPSGRYHNIGLAASILNGSLVMPGQVFSFNTTLGPTTADRGYK